MSDFKVGDEIVLKENAYCGYGPDDEFLKQFTPGRGGIVRTSENQFGVVGVELTDGEPPLSGGYWSMYDTEIEKVEV